jgi:hypothetical protein
MINTLFLSAISDLKLVDWKNPILYFFCLTLAQNQGFGKRIHKILGSFLWDWFWKVNHEDKWFEELDFNEICDVDNLTSNTEMLTWRSLFVKGFWCGVSLRSGMKRSIDCDWMTFCSHLELKLKFEFQSMMFWSTYRDLFIPDLNLSIQQEIDEMGQCIDIIKSYLVLVLW